MAARNRERAPLPSGPFYSNYPTVVFSSGGLRASGDRNYAKRYVATANNLVNTILQLTIDSTAPPMSMRARLGRPPALPHIGGPGAFVPDRIRSGEYRAKVVLDSSETLEVTSRLGRHPTIVLATRGVAGAPSTSRTWELANIREGYLRHPNGSYIMTFDGHDQTGLFANAYDALLKKIATERAAGQLLLEASVDRP